MSAEGSVEESLPRGWVRVTLADVASWGSGGTPKAGERKYYGGPIPWAVTGDLTEGLVVETASSLTETGLQASSAKLLEPGAVLIAMYGASIGRLGLVGRPMATNQAIACARPVEGVVDLKYLFWFLHSERGALRGAGKGAAQPNISQTVLKAWPIPLAPLPEQRRIVAAIEEHLSHLDAGVAALQRARRNLRRMRTAVMQTAVGGRLVPQDLSDQSGEVLVKVADEDRRQRWVTDAQKGKYKEPGLPALGVIPMTVPQGWAVASLEALTDPVRVICYGILKPKTKGDATVPYVEVRDLAKKQLDPNSLNRTTEAMHREFGRSILESGDVVLAIRGSYDRALVVPPSVAGANISRDVARIAPLSVLVPEFLHIYLSSPVAARYLASKARGVAVKGVNIGDLRLMPVPLPPLAEQERIVSEVDRVETLISDNERIVESAIRRSKSLRRAVLTAAFEGRLVLQDPTEEPATTLLGRTATAQASLPKRRPPTRRTK